MPNYSRGEIVLINYPFSNFAGSKVRPAIIVNGRHISKDFIIVPLTSKTTPLLDGEFVLSDWRAAGLNVPSAVKRGLFTLHMNLAITSIGNMAANDMQSLDNSLRAWLGLFENPLNQTF